MLDVDLAGTARVVCWEDVCVAVFFASTDEEHVCVFDARVLVEGRRDVEQLSSWQDGSAPGMDASDIVKLGDSNGR